MVAHMNAQALARTIETGEAWDFSRSRKRLWRKARPQANTQRVLEMTSMRPGRGVVKVEQVPAPATPGGALFYRAVPLGQTSATRLEFRDAEKMSIPRRVPQARALILTCHAVPSGIEVWTSTP